MRKLIFFYFLFFSYSFYSLNLNIYEKSREVINEMLLNYNQTKTIFHFNNDNMFWSLTNSEMNNLLFALNYLTAEKENDSYLNFRKEEKENPIRRAEILFFGSLTFSSFGAWIFFSLYNFLIYNEPFGRLKREQFLVLYCGCTVVSISVVLTDLFLANEKKFKTFSIY